jgi:septum site-determining protein MinD
MRGVSICIASGKGGVGKSTICANLGVAISRIGVRAIVVDADLEGASIGLIFGVGSNVPTLHDYLSGKIGLDETIFEVPSGPGLVIGSIRVDSLRDVKMKMFRDFIRSLEEKYDVVLVDVPPGLGADAITAISACDALLLVVTPDVLAISNALKTKIIAKKLKRKVIGIVVNRKGSKHDVPTKYIEDMMGTKVIGEIEEDEEVKKALARGELLVMRNSVSKAKKRIEKLAMDLVGMEK